VGSLCQGWAALDPKMGRKITDGDNLIFVPSNGHPTQTSSNAVSGSRDEALGGTLERQP
jgi:hypothetical protein